LEFEDEGRFLKRLVRASSIVTIYESNKASIELDVSGQKVPMPITYHTMEYAPLSLDRYLVDDDDVRERPPWPDKIRFWRGAVRGIHQMHLKGIVHRDLKSENCLVLPDAGRGLVCKLADLGRAKALGELARFTPESYATGRGDRRFAAPEFLFILGRSEPLAQKCADLYGLGSLLFELATGQPISFLALGFGPKLVQDNLAAARRGYFVDLDSLRPEYVKAVAVLAQQIPSAIRTRVSQLVMRLCDPVPENRLPRRLGNRLASDQALEWLMHEADILVKQLYVPSAYRRRGRTP